jgi:repressor LexA
MENLTIRQQQVLDYIAERIEAHGYPPTLREIAGHLGVTGTVSAIHHLAALERKGYLRRESGSSRGITLTRNTDGPGEVKEHPITNTSVSLPILGTIRAGMPEPAIEDILGYYSIDPSWVKGDDCYFLRVKGESMKDAGIMDGDLAIIHPQPTAENGQIVVAMVDGEATMKRFFREADHIRLQPENSAMEPIIIREGEGEAEAVVVMGRVLKTIHFFD